MENSPSLVLVSIAEGIVTSFSPLKFFLFSSPFFAYRRLEVILYMLLFFCKTFAKPHLRPGICTTVDVGELGGD